MEKEDIGIPKRLRVKRKYTMSDAALEQRRKAAQQPKPGMIGNRNAWKHGLHATSFLTRLKPCKTTCDKYPCDLIKDGATKPGEDCLDLEAMLGIIKAVHSAIENPKENSTSFNDLSSVIIGNNLHILQMMQEDLMRDGTIVKSEKYKNDELVSVEYKPHPCLAILPKMISELGMTPDQFMITPKAQDRSSTEQEKVRTLTEIFATAGNQLQAAKEQKSNDS